MNHSPVFKRHYFSAGYAFGALILKQIIIKGVMLPFKA